MSAIVVRVYKVFEKKFGSEVASEVVEVFEEFEQTLDKKVEEKMIIERTVNKAELATKGDLQHLETSTKQEINDLKVLMLEKFASQNKWFIMYAIAIFGLFATVIGLIITLLVRN